MSRAGEDAGLELHVDPPTSIPWYEADKVDRLIEAMIRVVPIHLQVSDDHISVSVEILGDWHEVIKEKWTPGDSVPPVVSHIWEGKLR